MLQQRLSLYRFLLYSVDLCMVALCWLLAYWLRFELFDAPFGISPFDTHFRLTILQILIFACVLPMMGLYRKPWTGPVRSISGLLKACALGVLIGVVLSYFFRSYEMSRAVFVLFFCLLPASLVLYRPLFFKIWSYLSSQPTGDRTLILGSSPMAQMFYDHIVSHPELGIRIMGFLTNTEDRLQGPPWLGEFNDLLAVLHRLRINTVIIVLPLDKYDMVQKLIKSLGSEMVDIKVLPDFSALTPLRGHMALLDDIPLISLHGNTLEGWPRVLKRLVDLLGALAGLLVFCIPMLAMALWIKKVSPGPLIYRQQRMGLDGRLFDMLKFRTMDVDAEKNTGPVWASEEDPRCIPKGNWIRRHNLDELPQLYNVLKGEMSLVGPRPERPELIAQFKDTIPGYMLRHRVKAGITGWAQINGWRGPTSLNRRIEYDLYYIENWSLALDLSIIWQTIVQTICPRKNGN